MLGLILLFVLAVALVAAPVGLAIAGIDIGFMSSAIMTGAGIALMVVLGIITVITKLYQRSRANEAFVRTGMGGVKVIQDGGALVIPVIHEFLRISLETLKLEVLRTAQDALITKDNLRADIGAEFFVKVQPNKEAILQAARSLGDKMTNVNAVKTAVEDKLISALRSVAATKTLSELHTDREAFVEEVTKAVNEDLAQNGLTLESVTISKLDQTNLQNLSDDNIFDAQGKRTIAEITERNKTARNELERAGEQARKQQDVETRKKVLSLEQDQKNAEAMQAAEIAKVKAEQDKEAKEKAIAAQKSVELAELEKLQKIEVAAIDKKRAAEVANEAKTQAVAEAAKAKAAKEAELAKAQALREKEMQAVKTVEIEATAEREKRKAVIAAEAKAEQIFVSEQRAADAKAYQVQKDAEARKAAADADAEATTKKANAEANAAKARAEGERAQALVPVQVERERVTIDQDRIEHVVKPELEARERSGKVAQDFEIAKLKVEADKEVRIETARAMATVGEKITMQLYGSPEHAAGMLKSLMSGQQVAEVVNSFTESVDPKVGDAVMGAVEGVGSLLKKKEPESPKHGDPAPGSGFIKHGSSPKKHQE
jgi:flotillin